MPHTRMISDDVALFALDRIPEICPRCGQTVDRNNAAAIDHHRRPGHMPYVRKVGAWRRR